MRGAHHCSGPPPRLRNDLYCVEWDVKLYYTIPTSPIGHRDIMYAVKTPYSVSIVALTDSVSKASYAVGAAMVYIQLTKVQ